METNEIKSDNIVAITTHANTPEKKQILKECISELKSQKYDIILSSHIPVDDDIVNSVDYFILDSENPIVTFKDYDKYNVRPLFLWYKQEHFSFNISFDLNHGYAVLKLIKNAASIAIANNYKKIHVVDYDYLIQQESILKLHNEFLNDYDVVSYYWDSRKDLISSGFFSIRTEFLIDTSKKINNLNQYFGFCHTSVFEELLYVLFNNGRIKHISDINLLREHNKVDQVHVSIKTPKKKTGDNLLLFITRENSKPDDIFLLMMLFDTEEMKMSIEINSKLFDVKIPTYKSFLVKIEKDWLSSGIKINITSYNYMDVLDNEKNIGTCDADPSIFYEFDDFLNNYRYDK